MDRSSPFPGSSAGRRRSQRLLLQIPVVVRGVEGKQAAFEEETETLVINAHGALIRLAARVQTGQKLVLKHPKTGEEQECSVIYLGSTDGQKSQVGIEFKQPSPYFWRVVFPPEDWTPRHPEARVRVRT